MNTIEAIILGILQGLTEFLPVSSSGHLVLAQDLMGVEAPGIAFEIMVHAATVMSTIVVFRKEIWALLSGLFKFKYNSETEYLLKIALSMIPILIIGVFLKDNVEALFGSGRIIVGSFLLLTALLLILSQYLKTREKDLRYGDALLIGLAQACAVIPGLSRSGTTISVGLMLGVKKDEVAKFSFLMVLIPILGEAFLQLVSGELSVDSMGITALPLISGFLAAFLSGLFACKVMIALVKRAKLTGFAIYCLVVGLISLFSVIF
jgi:Uncharacterized bacitracin resistance protein